MTSPRRRSTSHPVRLGKWLIGAVVAAAIAVPVTNLLSGSLKPPKATADGVRKLVHIRTSIEYQSGDHWVVPESRIGGEAAPDGSNCTPPEIRRKVQWFRDHDAIPFGGYWLRLEVVNDSQVTLTIESISLARFERLPPVSGRSVVLCSEGGGDIGTQYIALSLAAHPPSFRFYDDTYRPTAPFTFAPTRNAPVVSYIVMGADSPLGPPDHHRYRWTMQLRYSLAGHSYSQLINYHGRPFEVTT